MENFNLSRDILKSLKKDKILKNEKSFAIDLNNEIYINGVLDVYDSVWISNRNIDILIDKNAKMSFYNSGGMFYKPTFGEIKGMMEDENGSIITVNNNENVIGMLSLTTNVEILKNLNYHEEYEEKFIEEVKRQKVLNFLDIILVGEGKGIAYDLLLKASREFSTNQFKYWFVEIHTILGVYEEGVYSDLNHRNNASSSLVEKVGGYIIGDLGKKKFDYGKKTIEVVRNVYAIPMKESIELMDAHIKKTKEYKVHSA